MTSYMLWQLLKWNWCESLDLVRLLWKCIHIYGGRRDLIPSLLSPYGRGQQDVAVVLEVVNGAASQHDVRQDVAPEAVEHGAEPRGHGAAAGHLHRACDAQQGGGARGKKSSSRRTMLMVSVISAKHLNRHSSKATTLRGELVLILRNVLWFQHVFRKW